jgi:hypothetical protein
VRHNDPPRRGAKTCPACDELRREPVSYQEHTCGRRLEAAPRAAQDALEGGRP